MKTVVRRPNKTKAVVCLGAAVAVLVGGASTFARWAADADLLLTDSSPTSIKAGEWDLPAIVPLTITAERWHDSSPEITGAAYITGANCSPDNGESSWAECVKAGGVWTGITGNTHDGTNTYLSETELTMPAATKAAVANSSLARTANALLLTSDGTTTGTPFQDDDLVDYAIVPGDQLTGIYVVDFSAIDVEDWELIGEHLKVEATAISGAAINDPIFIDSSGANPTWGDVVTAHVYTASDSGWGAVLGTEPACYDETGAPVTTSTTPAACKSVTTNVWGQRIAIVIDYAYTENPFAVAGKPSFTELEKMRADYCKSHGGAFTGGTSPTPGTCSVDDGPGEVRIIQNWDGLLESDGTPTNPPDGTPTAPKLAITDLKVTFVQTR